MFYTVIHGFDDAQAKLIQLEEALDLDSVVDEAAAAILGRFRDRFLQQVDPDGSAWVPSHAALRRAARGQGGGTLFDTGRLFHSLQLFTYGPGERGIGTDVPYALGLQEGISEYGVAHPPWVFIGLGGDDIEMANKIIFARVDEALK